MAIFSLAEVKAKIDKLLEINKSGQKIVKIKKINLKNVTFILNPRATAIPYHQAIVDEELKQFNKQKTNSQELFFSREDQIDELKDMLYPGKDYDKILEKISPYISEDDNGALIYASMICKKENEKQEARDLINKLREAYKKRGLTLYNWLRCRDVFSQDIFPFLEFVKRKLGKEARSNFTPFWESLIKFHPHRIFVASKMFEEGLMDDILKRALLYKIKKICVYARKTRIGFARKIIKKLLGRSK